MIQLYSTMQAKLCKALVLTAEDRGEYDREYRLFTVDYGMVRARAAGVRRPGAKMVSLLNPGNLVELELTLGKRWYRIGGGLLIADYSSLRGSSMYRGTVELFELLSRILPEEQAEPHALSVLLSVLESFPMVSAAKQALWWEYSWWQVLGAMGYTPDWTVSAQSHEPLPADGQYVFLPSGGGVCEISEIHPRYRDAVIPVDRETLKLLRLLGEHDARIVDKLVVTEPILAQAAQVRAEYGRFLRNQ